MFRIVKISMGVITLVLLAHAVSLAASAIDLSITPRAAKPLNWISETLVVGPLGAHGGKIYLAAWLGLLFLLVGLQGGRGQGNAKETGHRPRRVSRAERKASEHAQSRAVLDEIIAEMNLDRVIAPQPAWQFLPMPAEIMPAPDRSWLGGTPVAPGAFQWPKFSNGRPLMFLAQICLADVKPSPDTGERPVGLPDDGALLIFIGFDGSANWEYDAQWFPASTMDQAVDHPTPSGAISPRELGLFWYEPALKYTPVRLNCVMDDEQTPLVSKFMGVEIGDPFGYHFPDGFQSLVFIKHDAAIGTASEDWQGMTIACPAANLSRASFDGGTVIGINNG